MNKRKYKPGSYIISLDDLMKQEFVYCAGKTCSQRLVW